MKRALNIYKREDADEDIANGCSVFERDDKEFQLFENKINLKNLLKFCQL